MGTISVALVDEHPIVLEALAALFSSEPGYSILRKGASLAGLAEPLNNTKPDILVVDPGQASNALSALQQICATNPNLKIIVFTSATGVDYAVRSLEIGVKGYVSKVSPPAELLHATRAVLGGETYISQNFACSVVAALRNESVRKVAAQALRFSVREDQIVHLLLRGKKNKEIAAHLMISEKTVKHYMSVLMQKLNARNRLEVVIAAQRLSSASASQGVAH
ncbi:response regulator transcription factor [Mesorhizobium sp. SB112]|uniref:response regulator transcription factor n=1 Tax=Mesorhizobium sp. SB112 TaxID=3151853 RepID=UPI003265793C